MSTNIASRLIVDSAPLQRLTKELKRAAASYVLVGIQSGTVTKSQTKNGRRKQAGQNMAQIGAWNEYGTQTIPARPFIRPAIQNNRRFLIANLQNQFRLICEGRQTTSRALRIIGQLAQNMIVRQINAVMSPPLSARTIARKGSSKPLIDFGQMRASIRYRVVTPTSRQTP